MIRREILQNSEIDSPTWTRSNTMTIWIVGAWAKSGRGRTFLTQTKIWTTKAAATRCSTGSKLARLTHFNWYITPLPLVASTNRASLTLWIAYFLSQAIHSKTIRTNFSATKLLVEACLAEEATRVKPRAVSWIWSWRPKAPLTWLSHPSSRQALGTIASGPSSCKHRWTFSAPPSPPSSPKRWNFWPTWRKRGKWSDSVSKRSSSMTATKTPRVRSLPYLIRPVKALWPVSYSLILWKKTSQMIKWCWILPIRNDFSAKQVN